MARLIVWLVVLAAFLGACSGSGTSAGPDVNDETEPAQPDGVPNHTLTAPIETLTFVDGSGEKYAVFELSNTGDVDDKFQLELSIDSGNRASGLIPIADKLEVSLRAGESTTIPVELRQTPTLGAFGLAHRVRLIATSEASRIGEIAVVTVTLVAGDS